MYTFQGVTDVELSLSFGDYVVVRKVCHSYFLHLISHACMKSIKRGKKKSQLSYYRKSLQLN